MPCKDCVCELTCENFARCVLEPIPEGYEAKPAPAEPESEPLAA